MQNPIDEIEQDQSAAKIMIAALSACLERLEEIKKEMENKNDLQLNI